MDVTDVVGRAARWFDEHWPAAEVGSDWWEVVNLRGLNMLDGCACVCGQLGAALLESEGYEVSRDWLIQNGEFKVNGFGLLRTFSRDVREAQIDLMVERGEMAGGKADLHRRWIEWESELVDVLRKRLEVGSEGEIVPDELGVAFLGGAGVNAAWHREISERRTGKGAGT